MINRQYGLCTIKDKLITETVYLHNKALKEVGIVVDDNNVWMSEDLFFKLFEVTEQW